MLSSSSNGDGSESTCLCVTVFGFLNLVGSSRRRRMLKVPEHQVAGHKAIDGRLGPLVDEESGHFYKPLQTGGRGSRELQFYTKLPPQILTFFPKFHGTKIIQASDGSGLLPHLVLEDVVWSYTNPSIMDVKIGSRTWYPQASHDYFTKCHNRDKQTTSLALGFRISGFQIYKGDDGSGYYYYRPERKEVLSFSARDVRLALKKFVSTDLGVGRGILSQLLELKSWFEKQSMYQFNSTSVLMFYDKAKGKEARPMVKLIDFAHVYEGESGVIDHNFLGGLCSFIKFIQDTLEEEEEEAGAQLILEE